MPNKVSDIAATVFNTTLILYAEHEFNASTFVARNHPYRVRHALRRAAAIGTLKGPLHGGANESPPSTYGYWGTEKLSHGLLGN